MTEFLLIECGRQNDSEYWYMVGLSTYNLKKHNDSIKYLDKAIEINNLKSNYWYLRAKNYNKTHYYEKCLDDIDRTIELDEANSSYWILRG